MAWSVPPLASWASRTRFVPAALQMMVSCRDPTLTANGEGYWHAKTKSRMKCVSSLPLILGIALLQANVATAAGRVTIDRPDDIAGYQVHLMYVVPSDGTDAQLDTNGQIATSAAAWNAWLGRQTGGKTFRLDTYQGSPDITFLRLNLSDSEIASFGGQARDVIEQAMNTAGFGQPNKIYAVYYGGRSTVTCGNGAYPPTLPGNAAVVYLNGEPPNARPCNTNPLGMSVSNPGYFEYLMVHELMHTLGFVAACAPHQTLAGHVSDSNSDLMYSGPLPWVPSVLDIGHNDYYMANIPGCPDLARNAYLSYPDTRGLVAAVLPTSRSVEISATATVFATVINTTDVTATSCGIYPGTVFAASLDYQAVDPRTNVPTGMLNSPGTIAAHSAQSYVVAVTPSGPLSAVEIPLTFQCGFGTPATVRIGLNTVLLSASAIPGPDIVALAATVNGNGIVDVAGVGGSGAFAVATVNLGAGGQINASADTGGAALPIIVSLCQTIPATGACLGAPTSSVTMQISSGKTPTFAIFVSGIGPVRFDPANNRIFVRFKDTGGVTRGSTSVAVRTQ